MHLVGFLLSLTFSPLCIRNFVTVANYLFTKTVSAADFNFALLSEVTMDVIAAQAFVFYLAGFETSSTTMTFCLYELARNPDIQERVRNDIDTVLQKHDGNITYEAISEMGYLNKVVSGE